MTRMTRRERIVFLLDHWDDVHGPAGGRGGSSFADDNSYGFPTTSSMAEHSTIVELGRCLELLARMAPRHCHDVHAYFGAGWTIAWRPKRSRNGKTLTRLDEFGKRVPVTEPHRVRELPRWLVAEPRDAGTGEPRTVARGIDFISAAFKGEVFLPAPLLEAAA